ncbi:hypothetical protein HPB48_023595 [Haemaphysalis longicornis]|uniref:Uncharacterized protein n=1 Tax=Haemaphysalis longicornis TaxID=44386 RepID=A0A9J6H5G5_HAELO|nr:hypothetical protein HPB48_023595 [Haemaphysalis longicornis]
MTLHMLSTRYFPMDHLDISHGELISSTSLMSIANGPFVLGLTTLRIIVLPIEDCALSYNAQKLTRLAYLYISPCKGITKDAIVALDTHLNGLRMLFLRYVAPLRGSAFKPNCQMPCLDTVFLKGCSGFSGRSVMSLVCGDLLPSILE